MLSHESETNAHGVHELMTHELRHRFANELAMTLATLQIVKARGHDDALISDAIDRVEAQGRILRDLCDPRPPACIGSELLGELCHLMLRSNPMGRKMIARISANDVTVDGTQARLLRLVAYEIFANAFKHMEGGRRRIVIRAREKRRWLTISNPVHHVSSLPGSGTGLATVRALVALAHGHVHFASSGGIFRSAIDMPMHAPGGITHGTRGEQS